MRMRWIKCRCTLFTIIIIITYCAVKTKLAMKKASPAAIAIPVTKFCSFSHININLKSKKRASDAVDHFYEIPNGEDD
jgi:hypothetical protein